MNSNDDLKERLAAWEVEVEIPPRFQANVWAQIAARESARRSWWEPLRDAFAAAFAQPQMAVAVVTLSLTLSVGTAVLKAQDSNAAYGKQLEGRYMETINPLAHASHSL